MSIHARGRADTVLAVGLVRHLAIRNNLPLPRVTASFSRICDWLLVEFVAKTDSQVRWLLRNREDIFQDCTEQAFLHAIDPYFTVEDSFGIEGMDRTAYLMRRRQANP